MKIDPMQTHAEATDAVARHGARWLRSRFSGWILAGISFAESVFAPILIDPFLIALIIASPKRWFTYTVISIVSSVLGGIVAYFLGAFLFDTFGTQLLAFFKLEGAFASVMTQVAAGGFMFVLIGAITPIPYKLVALAAGLLHIHFIVFLIASIIGRTIRLGIVGFVTHMFGPHALAAVRPHMHVLSWLLIFSLLVYILYTLLA